MEDFVRNDLWSTDHNTVQFAMRRIIHDFLRKDTQAFLLMGGHLVVLRAMERFRTSHQIQFEGSRILRELVDKQYCTVLSDCATFETLLTAMRNHPKQQALLSLICYILECQCRYRLETNEKFRETVIQQSLQVMKRFPKEPHSKNLLLTALGDTDEGHGLLTHYEGIGIMINAMKECATEARVQSLFSDLLRKLGASSRANKREIILHDGIVVIATTLQRFHSLTSHGQGNAEVQGNAERALQVLCASTNSTTTNTTTNNNNNNNTNNGGTNTGNNNGV
jgi:hypothetical protein